MDVRRLGPEGRDAAVATLAEAFHDDAMLRILEPDDRRRAAVARWFFGRVVRYGLRWAEVWAIDDGSAVAVWVPPGSGSMSTSRMLRVGMAALPLRVGIRGTTRFLAAVAALGELHELMHGRPHWYLPAVGTRRDREGRGYGSALLRVTTDRADAAGLPCYLEATAPANEAFYAKRNFEVIGRRAVGGFTFTGMVRPPGDSPGRANQPAPGLIAGSG
jgi:GNAT superfamily N-acetyltransferase